MRAQTWQTWAPRLPRAASMDTLPLMNRSKSRSSWRALLAVAARALSRAVRRLAISRRSGGLSFFFLGIGPPPHRGRVFRDPPSKAARNSSGLSMDVLTA